MARVPHRVGLYTRVPQSTALTVSTILYLACPSLPRNTTAVDLADSLSQPYPSLRPLRLLFTGPLCPFRGNGVPQRCWWFELAPFRFGLIVAILP